ncbi:MAG: Ig-like domain-containing protein, partial [Desulfococcaceae bacterium]
CLWAAPTPATATNIDTVEKYAWSETAGWVNFRPSDGGVRVYGDHLEGFAWAENLGWIQLGSHDGGGPHTYGNTTAGDWGVNRDGAGGLSGYAWSEVAGWINFSPTDGGVTVDPATGRFDGYAWSENLGWISFSQADPSHGVSLTLNRVTSVFSPDPDGLYGIGDTVGVAVEFSAAVSTVGSPSLTLATGTADAAADYLDGGGTEVLRFAYTVSEAEESADLAYASSEALTGTLRDSFGLSAITTLPQPGAEGSLSANADLVVDGIRPTATLSSPAPDIVGDSFEVTATFSEPVTGFEAADLVVDNGAIGDFSGDGDTYTVSVTPEVGGAVTVELPADAAEDMAGNEIRDGATLSRQYDDERPAVTLSSPSGDSTSVSPIEVTITFSEPVTGFDAAGVSATNGTVGDFAGEGATYAVSVIPSAEGAVTVNVPAEVARDGAGNWNLAAAPLVRTYDATPPNATLSSSSSEPTADDPIRFAANFSEPVFGFDAADVSATNGTVIGFDGAGASYSIRIAPLADGPVTVEIRAGAARDAAGNENRASASLVRTYDGVPPEPTLSSSSPETTADAPIPFTVTFSEPVIGFDAAGVTAINGTVTGFAGEGATYAFDVAPLADGAVTVEVLPGAARDAAGNESLASAPLIRTYLGTGPKPALSTEVPEFTNASPIEVTATFDRPVTGFEAAGVDVTNGTVSGFDGAGDAYAIAVAPAADGLVTIQILPGAARDAAGNESLASDILVRTYLSAGPEATLSTEAPDPTDASPIQMTATFSEPVTGFEAEDLSVTNGTVGDFEGSGDAYTFSVTPEAEGEVTVDLPPNSARDAAGNGNLAASRLSIEYQRSPAIIADAGPDQETVSGAPVTLDAADSTVPEEETVAYRWTQTGGPAVSLSNPESPVTRFTAPEVGGDGGVLSFELTITNEDGDTFRDAVSVRVFPGQAFPSSPPALTGPEDGAVFEAETVRLTAALPPEGQRPPGLRVQWRVRRAERGYGCPTDPPGFFHEGSDLAGYAVSGVHSGQTYAWQAGYVDPRTGRTAWSEERSFTAGAATQAHTLSVPPGETSADYRMISIPVDPGGTAESSMGHLIGGYDPRFQRIGVYDPRIGGYVEYGEGIPFEPGRPVWILAREGLEITLRGAAASPFHANELDLAFDPSADRGWNMIAAPDGGNYPWREVELLVYAGEGGAGGSCELVAGPTPLADLPADNPWLDKRLWRWEEGEYRPDAEILNGGDGYWVRARAEGVALRFPADARTETPLYTRALRRGADWLDALGAARAIAGDGETPPAPPAALASGTGASQINDGEGCFIEAAGLD